MYTIFLESRERVCEREGERSVCERERERVCVCVRERKRRESESESG